MPSNAGMGEESEYDLGQQANLSNPTQARRRNHQNDRTSNLEQDSPEISETAIHDVGQLARSAQFSIQEEQREHRHSQMSSGHDIDMAI